MTDERNDEIIRRAMRLLLLIPPPVVERMEEFAETGKTGQVTLNYLRGADSCGRYPGAYQDASEEIA